MAAGRGSTNGMAGATVTGQNPGTQPGPNGRFVDGMLVHFTTATGVASSVFVPDTLYTADTVRQMIAAKARTIDEVSGLGGTV